MVRGTQTRRTSTVAAAAAAAASTVTAVATAAAAAAISDHLGKAGVDLLLGLLQNRHEVAGLLGICAYVSSPRPSCWSIAGTYCQW